MTSLRASQMEKGKQPAKRCENCRSYRRIANTYGMGWCSREDCQHYGHVLVVEHPGCRYHRKRRR